MSAARAESAAPTSAALQALAERIRARRKALRLSTVSVAEAAGVSRVTLYRIERGEPSVAIGAWAQVMQVLNLDLAAEPEVATPDSIPETLPLRRYPQLSELAWHVDARESLTPDEALDLYERNARHLDRDAMTGDERALFDALQRRPRKGRRRV